MKIFRYKLRWGVAWQDKFYRSETYEVVAAFKTEEEAKKWVSKIKSDRLVVFPLPTFFHIGKIKHD